SLFARSYVLGKLFLVDVAFLNLQVHRRIAVRSRSRYGRGEAVATHHALGGVDSKDSLLSANQIQGCFWGGSLGCDGPFGIERRGVGADGAADHRSPRPEGLHWARQ